MQENSINFSQVSKTMNRLTKRTIETLNFYENEEKDYSFKIYSFHKSYIFVSELNEAILIIHTHLSDFRNDHKFFINDEEFIFKYFSKNKEIIFKERLGDNFKFFCFSSNIISVKFLFRITVINIYKLNKISTFKLPGKLKYIYVRINDILFISDISIIKYDLQKNDNNLSISRLRKISIKYQNKTYILYAYQFEKDYFPEYLLDCGYHYREIKMSDPPLSEIDEDDLAEETKEMVAKQCNHITRRKYKNYFEYKIK
jgi:hypothetical protein